MKDGKSNVRYFAFLHFLHRYLRNFLTQINISIQCSTLHLFQNKKYFIPPFCTSLLLIVYITAYYIHDSNSNAGNGWPFILTAGIFRKIYELKTRCSLRLERVFVCKVDLAREKTFRIEIFWRLSGRIFD